MNRKKLLRKILNSQKNIRFSEFIHLVEGFGFRQSRISGSHHIFVSPAIKELVNIQNVNGQAKPYQIKQFLTIVERYNLTLED